MKKILLFISILSVLSFAQNREDISKSFGIELKLSVIEQARVETDVSVGNIGVSADVNNLAGIISLNYYYNEKYVLTFSTGVISAKTDANVEWTNVSTETSAVIPLLFGGKFYFIDLFEDVPFRPFLGFSAGVLIGSETKTELISTSVSTQSAMVGHIGAGIDLFLNNTFKLNMEAGFNLASDFDKPVSGKRNYSSGEFSIGLGIIF